MTANLDDHLRLAQYLRDWDAKLMSKTDPKKGYLAQAADRIERADELERFLPELISAIGILGPAGYCSHPLAEIRDKAVELYREEE